MRTYDIPQSKKMKMLLRVYIKRFSKLMILWLNSLLRKIFLSLLCQILKRRNQLMTSKRRLSSRTSKESEQTSRYAPIQLPCVWFGVPHALPFTSLNSIWNLCPVTISMYSWYLSVELTLSQLSASTHSLDILLPNLYWSSFLHQWLFPHWPYLYFYKWPVTMILIVMWPKDSAIPTLLWSSLSVDRQPSDSQWPTIVIVLWFQL